MKTLRKRSNGITFIEIMMATLILGIALLPIFYMIHKGTEDTDSNSATAFALNKATEVLNTVLDSVPFEALRQGCPGIMCTNDICTLPEYSGAPFFLNADSDKTITKMLFGDRTGYESSGVAGGFLCQGKIADPRGITYLITLSVEEVVDTATGLPNKAEEKLTGDFAEVNAVTMSFLKNPQILDKAGWVASYQPNTLGLAAKGARDETDFTSPQGVAAPDKNIYSETDFGTTRRRLHQQLFCDKVRYTTPTPYVCMKRLIVEVQWNLDHKLYKTPESSQGLPQRLHLISFKGDTAR